VNVEALLLLVVEVDDTALTEGVEATAEAPLGARAVVRLGVVATMKPMVTPEGGEKGSQPLAAKFLRCNRRVPLR